MEPETVASEEASAIARGTEARGNELPKPAPSDPPRVVREAEHKLKEMSRKAKERKSSQNSRQPKGLSEINYFWLVIGGLGALGVGYLVFGKKEEAPKSVSDSTRHRGTRHRGTRQRGPKFKFVPRPKTPEKAPLKEPVIEKEEKPASTFELNCF